MLNIKVVLMVFCYFASLWAADIGLKFTGISVDPQGTEGVDYVVERLWYDLTTDDDVIIYIKSNVNIALYHNSDNLLGKGYEVNGQYPGDIWYKIDGDECGIGQKYHSYGSTKIRDPLIYNVIQFKYAETGPFNLAAFKGKVDIDNGQPEYNAEHFHYGLTDDFGDEWHILTFWDDDSATVEYVDNLKPSNGDTRDACSSDGKIVYLVLDPQTPAIQFVAPAGEEFYTTPAKTYYTPHIFQPQTTYLTSGVKIRLYNLLDSSSVYYRVDQGEWQEYTGELTASNLFNTDGKIYEFEYKNGVSGVVKLRLIHYNPTQPAQTEAHPKLRFASEAQLESVKVLLHGGDQELMAWYNNYKDEYYQHLSANYRIGKRNLDGTFPYTSYYYFIKRVGDAIYANAFVGRMEDYDEIYLKQAKEGLLYLYTIDPLGCENFDGRAGGPCQERVMYLSLIHI